MLKNLELKYDYSDVHMVPQDSDIASRSLVNLEREYTFKWSPKRRTGVGIIAANMDTVGTIEMAVELARHKVFTALHKHYKLGEMMGIFSGQESDFIFYTLGTSQHEFERLLEFSANALTPEMICIDIANGHSNILLDAIKRVRSAFPESVIMAGNVVTGERAAKVIEAGADIVKVGIGPGSACTTRKQTGVGYPQLSAVYECANAVDVVGGMVCADGGCTVPGDIAKAFVAGADFVMLGGMLAGTDESGGKIVLHKKVPKKSVKVVSCASADSTTHQEAYEFRGSVYDSFQSLPPDAWKTVPLDEPKMLFYGMSSDTAMDKYSGGVAKYRSSEGRTVLIPYKGRVGTVIEDILGGLRSAMTYIGVIDIKDAPHATHFVETRTQLNTVFVK